MRRQSQNGDTDQPKRSTRRQWRDWRTSSGRRPIKEFIDALSDEDAAKVVAAMAEVARDGLKAAKHLRGEIYEVIADGRDKTYRVLFAAEGRFKQVLLSLDAFAKKTQKTPGGKIALAEKRLREWRERTKSDE